jgi:hypothetical protein
MDHLGSWLGPRYVGPDQVPGAPCTRTTPPAHAAVLRVGYRTSDMAAMTKPALALSPFEFELNKPDYLLWI